MQSVESVEIVEQQLADPVEGVRCAPAAGSRAGVLVLAGSSGRIETDRCRLLARAGLMALSIRWFGGPGQPAGICEIPLETFARAIDRLRADGAERIGVLGTSKGAEAALLLALRDPRVDAVVALAPTDLVWANVGPGADGVTAPYRSSWSWQGVPLPFVPYDDTWQRAEPEGAPVAFRSHYQRSRRTFAEAAGLATIPIERTDAEVLLVAGGDDEMWPALDHARALAARARKATLISHDGAGHRVRLPGETPLPPSPLHRHGGTPEADAELGARAWPEILRLLRG
ncbi:dienelactone hydrolase [Kitasatospora sp. GAS204A]|uniref:acyl-CoA thioester hydrolase/BAAT C-terminal domain-containing protein n=1 Tax=unclassified Kitasatospora TaxID=2633591 RepID=UPI002474206B|nr:acyl-CoA thioester hydrolase/BAAT C-terminal domain-containing protein [Kitasatospora sp. GAS204B]MDH6115831.1 dienelactone hydrolase [Kitasatospora sp. GAS204B]